MEDLKRDIDQHKEKLTNMEFFIKQTSDTLVELKNNVKELSRRNSELDRLKEVQSHLQVMFADAIKRIHSRIDEERRSHESIVELKIKELDRRIALLEIEDKNHGQAITMLNRVVWIAIGALTMIQIIGLSDFVTGVSK